MLARHFGGPLAGAGKAAREAPPQEAKSFGQFGERWLQEARMADSTRAMRRSIFERDILRRFAIGCCRILPEDLRGLCAKVKERGRRQRRSTSGTS
jgi:hypothetical protein